MVERPETRNEGDAMRSSDAASAASKADLWFVREVLPLEAPLMQFLHRNWHNPAEIADLRQETYIRVYEAARRQLPEKPRQFVFTTARNLIIDRVRRARVIPIESASDSETFDVAADEPGPDRVVQARDELRQMRDALDRLQPRHREAIVLGRIEGLSRQQVAQRMGITELTAAQYLKLGIAALTDLLYRAPEDKS
jgi:RNA polymerase sigma-70 factor (ECF subfamily)